MPLLAACQLPARVGRTPQRLASAQAPFDMPAIAIPAFWRQPAFSDHRLRRRPARPAEHERSDCRRHRRSPRERLGRRRGPGRVWPTGPVHLKSNVNLHVEAGAVLLFSGAPRDYLPPVASSWSAKSGRDREAWRIGAPARNIVMRNVSATRLAGGVPSFETDALYQWRTLMPTIGKRLTPISAIHAQGVSVQDAQFVCRIKGQAELPVRDVRLRNVRVASVRGPRVETEHVDGFDDDGQQRSGA